MDHTKEKNVIALSNVTKTFPLASGEFTALKNVNISIGKGQLVGITGKSGSGKSTLLNILTGIDRPTEGAVIVQGVRIDRLSENDLASWRGKNIGVVFQFFQLIPTLTVLENVMLPMDFCNTYAKKDRSARARMLLEQVNIAEQCDKFPSALSGGQQQRVAIARALANDPAILVADEPTGNLDSQTAAAVFQLFGDLVKTGKTVIVVTHEKEFTSYFENHLFIADGHLVKEEIVSA